MCSGDKADWRYDNGEVGYKPTYVMLRESLDIYETELPPVRPQGQILPQSLNRAFGELIYAVVKVLKSSN